MANFALASHLAGAGDTSKFILSAIRVSPKLAALQGVHVHHVPRPLGIHRLGEPMLRSASGPESGAAWRPSNPRTLANGGNADLGDLNWVHYVHAAFDPPAAGLANRLRDEAGSTSGSWAEERRALEGARLVICNSRRTADDVVKLADVARDRTRVVYLGDRSPPGSVESSLPSATRRDARSAFRRRDVWHYSSARSAIGRKGFDTLFNAWLRSVRPPRIGTSISSSQVPARSSNRGKRARRVSCQTAACTSWGSGAICPWYSPPATFLIHPARYEAYGLGATRSALPRPACARDRHCRHRGALSP